MRFPFSAFAVFLLSLFLTACDSGPQEGGDRLTVWAHSGQAAERQVIQEQVARFNAKEGSPSVSLTFIPERDYNAQVQAAAIAGELPDVLEFDGPFLYNYAWQGHLRPLDDRLPRPLLEDLLPSVVRQGTYRGRLYGVGAFDSGLGLFARRSLLTAAGVRIPHGPSDAWSADEFDRLLAALARRDPDGAVLDLKLNYPPEWFTYAFSPLTQSAGGDLIDRRDYQSSAGVLNGPEAVAAMTRLQSWLQRGYVDPNVDDGAFVGGRVALSWAGHWEYRRYAQAFGTDLVVLPLPNLGKGTRTGQGSWVWGITRRCRQPEAAARFLRFLLQTDEVLAMSGANGAVPATRSAIARSPLYRGDGPLHLFAEQLMGGYSVPRPRTPAYPVITSAFQQVFQDIRNGADPEAALDKAVAVIDQDIRDNRGYPPLGAE